MDILQLTQDAINDQNRNYDDSYLSNAEVGDWVYDDGEILCSQSCVEHWYHTSSTEKEAKNWSHIFDRLESLNSK